MVCATLPAAQSTFAKLLASRNLVGNYKASSMLLFWVLVVQHRKKQEKIGPGMALQESGTGSMRFNSGDGPRAAIAPCSLVEAHCE